MGKLKNLLIKLVDLKITTNRRQQTLNRLLAENRELKLELTSLREFRRRVKKSLTDTVQRTDEQIEI